MAAIYTVKDCHDIAKFKGGKYLSPGYMGYDQKAEWECPPTYGKQTSNVPSVFGYTEARF